MKTYHYHGEATLVPIGQIHPTKMTGRKEPKLPRLEKAREELASGAAIAPCRCVLSRQRVLAG